MDSSLPAVTAFYLRLPVSSDRPEEPQGATLVSDPTRHNHAKHRSTPRTLPFLKAHSSEASSFDILEEILLIPNMPVLAL